MEDGYSNYLWTTNESGNTITVTDPGLYGVLVFSANGCASSAEVVIQQRSVPLVGIDGPNNLCSNELAVLDPGSDYIIYSWATGDTTQTIEVNQSGIYELTVFDRFGCEGFARALLQVREAPDFDIVGPNALCNGDTINLAITSDSLYRSYLWSDGTMDPNLEVRQPGMYSVSVMANNNCLTEDSIDIMPLLAPEPQIVGDTNFCAGGFTILEADTIYAAYQWTGGRSSQSIRISTAGVYELRVTSVEGCVGTDEVLVNALALPDADAGPDSILNCYQPEIQLGRMISTDQERFLYAWSGPGISNDQQSEPQPIVSEGGTYILEVQDTLFGCPPAQDEVIITDIQYTPQLNIASQDTLDCIDTSITIVAIAEVGPDIEYQWIQLSQNQLRSTTPEILINQGGNYSFTVLDTLTGCNQIDTIAIIANQQHPLLKEPTIGFINCRKDSHILIAPQAPIGSLWSYAWARADGTFGTPSLDSLRQTVFEPGFYGIRVEDTENGCVTFDSLLVRDDRNFPDVMAGPDDELDCTFTEVQLGVPVDNRDWIISWTRLEDFTFGSSLPQPTVDQPGTYVVEAFDPRTECTQIDSVTITQYDNAPDSLELRINDVVCYGERNGLIQVLGVTGGEQPLLYSLNERPFSSGRQFANLEAGAYNLIVQDARGCELRQRILVQPRNDVFVDLGPDQYIQQGDRVRLRALTSIPDGQVRELRWTRPDTLSCDTCIIQNLLPLETMNLQAIAVDTNGCRGQDNVNIFVDKRKRVYIPTAFSPDGDGLNDVIMIYAARDVQRVRSWRIFDRWGELVWEKQDFPPNDPTFGWDGQWRNALQQKRKQEDRFILMNAQVYVYYAEIEFIDGDVVLFKGDFTLMK
ncbi:MAG: gliding motility-associated C-terminal domain-containing protein [Saprospiraceae bacterium]|nr:gliding motility-associated C-terminal domain-containing protein [Saprospiraceae bacterium]